MSFGLSFVTDLKINPISRNRRIILEEIVDITRGHNYYIAKTDGHFYCWGYNYKGQFGNSKRYKNSNESIKLKNNQPELNQWNNLNIDVITCGLCQSLALTSSEEVFAWGRNEFGQVGNRRHKNKLVPKKVKGFEKEIVTMISCGIQHSLALTKSGLVFSWGDNQLGQLGI